MSNNTVNIDFDGLSSAELEELLREGNNVLAKVREEEYQNSPLREQSHDIQHERMQNLPSDVVDPLIELASECSIGQNINLFISIYVNAWISQDEEFEYDTEDNDIWSYVEDSPELNAIRTKLEEKLRKAKLTIRQVANTLNLDPELLIDFIFERAD